MNYDEIYKILPVTIGNSIKQCLMEDKIQEIRIKVGKPIILNLAFEEKVLDYIPTREDLRYLITKISNYSLYAFEEELLIFWSVISTYAFSSSACIFS